MTMTNTIKIGDFLYSKSELPMYAKVLTVLTEKRNGASTLAVSKDARILKDFNKDEDRAKAKVEVAVSNLRNRGVVVPVQSKYGIVLKIANNDAALTLIAEGGKVVEGIAARTVQASDDVKVVSNSKTKKVNTMATKNVKTPRMFLNPETNAVEAFGIGRPSKVKLAFECDATGKLLNPEAAAAISANGGKSDDKLTKAELLKIVADLRSQVRDLTEQRDQLAEIVEASTGEADDVDASESDDDSLEAEAVETDDDVSLEVEAA